MPPILSHCFIKGNFVIKFVIAFIKIRAIRDATNNKINVSILDQTVAADALAFHLRVAT